MHERGVQGSITSRMIIRMMKKNKRTTMAWLPPTHHLPAGC